MTHRHVVPFFAVVLLVAAGLVAQETPPRNPKPRPRPVFSPPEETPPPAVAPAPKRGPESAPAPADATTPQDPIDPVDALFARLDRFPQKTGRDAADALSGLGDKVADRLVEALGSNDWRVQAGAAHALAEMKWAKAAPALVRAVREPTNRAGLPWLMEALVRIDPLMGPAEVLPFVTSSAGGVREAAMKAMPETLDARYTAEVLAMCASVKAPIRVTGFTLLGRIPGVEDLDAWFEAFLDPEVGVADAASRHLALHASPKGTERLLGAAREGVMRSAAYAMLTLAGIEESGRGWKIPEDDAALRGRAMKFLQGDDPFHRASAAVLLATVAYRARDAALRDIADRYLVPILLDAVAGGVFFNDYVAVEGPVFRRLELLTGEAFGPNAPKWKAWWPRVRDTFKARRRIVGLSAEELATSSLMVRLSDDLGRTRAAFLTGDLAEAERPRPGAPLWIGMEACTDLAAEIAASGLLDAPPARGDAPPGEGWEVLIRRGGDTALRRGVGPPQGRVKDLVERVLRLQRDLSWQRFAPTDPTARRAWLDAEMKVRAGLDPAAREARLLDSAVGGFAGFAKEARTAAAEVMASAPTEWRLAQASRLAAFLRAEAGMTEEARLLVEALAVSNDVKVRDAVFDTLTKYPGFRAEEALKRYLAPAPTTAAVAALRSGSAGLRSVAAEELGRRRGDPAAADALIDGLRDYEPRVRETCIRALAQLNDPRTPALLETVLASGDRGLRARAIEALGGTGGDASVPKLVEIYREGSVPDRFAVLRGLQAARGRRAAIALGTLARESTDAALAAEAVATLGRMRTRAAADETATLFAKSKDKSVKLQAAVVLGDLLGPAAAGALVPALSGDDKELARAVALTLGRAGAKEALAPLLEFLRNPAGDPAAETAFRRLTYFGSVAKAPASRFAEYERWVADHGDRDRAEWLRIALRAAQLDTASCETFLATGRIDRKGVATLIRAIGAPNPGLRDGADVLLRRITGLPLDAFAPEPSAEDVAAHRDAFERWANGRADLLGVGVVVPSDNLQDEPKAPESR